MKTQKKDKTVLLPRKKGEHKKRDLLHQPLEWSKLNHPTAQKWIIIFFVSVILSSIISYSIPTRTYKKFVASEVASQNIKAPQDFLVEDRPATLEKRKKATEDIRAVYDFDLQMITTIERRLDYAFKVMREYFPGPNGNEVREGEPTEEELEALLEIPISDSSFALLRKRKFDPNILDYIYRILDPMFEQGIISDRELLMTEKDKGIVLRFFPTREESILQDFSRIMDLGQARSRIAKEARLLISSSERSLGKPVVEIAQGLLFPNITFNKVETEERKITAREAVKPVLFEIKKGEMIVREGEKITPEHLLKLNQLSQLKSDRNPLVYTLGNFLIVLLLLAIVFSFSILGTYRNSQGQSKDLMFVGVMLVVVTLMIRVGTSMPEAEQLFLSNDAFLYAVPVATGAIVISVVMGIKQSTIFAVLIAIFSTMVAGYRMESFFYPFIGSLIGAREALACKQRSTLVKAGLWVGVANVLVILCLKITSGNVSGWEPLVGDVGIGFFSGIFSGIIATGLVPLIEVVFSYTTDVKLLELSNLNHPLLKELVMKAPGTYHHSIMTGSMVEATAEGIGANPLLARVGAYYHDLGKMKKPLYFIENQKGMENKHDKLSPNMSSLILISHIKEGVEKAKEYRLGNVITDIIQQHHGTSLISYFYQKAQEKENPAEATVDEDDFRYSGPKPQTKEAGLIMLADAVEAASRALTEPTPARTQGLVNKTINSFFIDGQLDECELALKDLHFIAKSFHRILTGIFHHRIEYPEKHETLDQESPKEAKDRFKNGQEDREGDIKRLGIS